MAILSQDMPGHELLDLALGDPDPVSIRSSIMTIHAGLKYQYGCDPRYLCCQFLGVRSLRQLAVPCRSSRVVRLYGSPDSTPILLVSSVPNWDMGITRW